MVDLVPIPGTVGEFTLDGMPVHFMHYAQTHSHTRSQIGAIYYSSMFIDSGRNQEKPEEMNMEWTSELTSATH